MSLFCPSSKWKSDVYAGPSSLFALFSWVKCICMDSNTFTRRRFDSCFNTEKGDSSMLCRSVKICSTKPLAYGALFLMFRICSSFRIFSCRIVCPIYWLLQVLQVAAYTPLLLSLSIRSSVECTRFFILVELLGIKSMLWFSNSDFKRPKMCGWRYASCFHSWVIKKCHFFYLCFHVFFH